MIVAVAGPGKGALLLSWLRLAACFSSEPHGNAGAVDALTIVDAQYKPNRTGQARCCAGDQVVNEKKFSKHSTAAAAGRA